MTQAKVLNFDGNKYDLSQLSDEAKATLRDVRLADGQIRMSKANLRVLNVGRTVLVAKLKDMLSGVPTHE